MTPEHYYDPEQLRARRQARRARRRRKMLIRNSCCVAFLLVLALTIGAAVSLTSGQQPPQQQDDLPSQQVQAEAPPVPVEPEPVVEPEPDPPYAFYTTADTVQVDSAFPSKYVILADLETGEILAQRDPDERISPASMTKILTLLVAVEHAEDLDATFTMTREMADYCFVNNCSVVGYEVDESATLRELLYGCIMNSGADACLGMAQIIAGSHEAFVELMNQKLEELGLAETSHFTNCVGLYDENHYCTVADMALMLKAALENELCREVLSTRTIATAPTPQHPESQNMSNWFIRRIEDLDSGGVNVFTGKTGYVEQAGFCAASCGLAPDGREYLCVTAKSTGTWQSIRDHAALYKTYVGS